MVHQDSLLVTLVQPVDRLPMPSIPVKRGRGRPTFYPNAVFLSGIRQQYRKCGRTKIRDGIIKCGHEPQNFNIYTS